MKMITSALGTNKGSTVRLLVACCLGVVAGQSAAMSSPSEFCASVRDLPLKDIEATSRAIGKIEAIRSHERSTGNGRLPEDIERLISPYRLSPELSQAFAERADISEYDYTIYRNADASLFNFESIEGSAKCASDIWATRAAGNVAMLPEGPDLGDACDVVRLVGVHAGVSVLIQYEFGAKDYSAVEPAEPPIAEVRAIRMELKELNEVCIIPMF